MSKKNQITLKAAPEPAAKPAAKRETFPPAPVRSPQVFAGDCPKSATHTQTRVYRTVGPTRYCVCDDCGHTWKLVGPPASA